LHRIITESHRKEIVQHSQICEIAMEKEFNIIICGVGGQGLITLLRILAEAALMEGFDVRTSEVHGLSQREGSVQTHIRFGEKIFSPLISKGKADLILGLEACEVLRVVDFLNEKTVFLINKKFVPYFEGPLGKEVFKNLEKLPARVFLVEASQICQKELGREVLAGVFLLGFAAFKNLIPLKPTFVLRAIKKIIPKDFFAMNKKAFLLAKKHGE